MKCTDITMFDLMVVLAELGEAFGVKFGDNATCEGGLSASFARCEGARWDSWMQTWRISSYNTSVRLEWQAMHVNVKEDLKHMLDILQCTMAFDVPGRAYRSPGMFATKAEWLGTEVRGGAIRFASMDEIDSVRHSFSFSCMCHRDPPHKETWPVGMVKEFERLVKRRKSCRRWRRLQGVARRVGGIALFVKNLFDKILVPGGPVAVRAGHRYRLHLHGLADGRAQSP